jgi:hypothetical protein
MRAFTCAVCGNLLAFENSVCLRCGTETGYDPQTRALIPLDAKHLRCGNAEIAGCNWLVLAGAPPLCESCELTRTRPDDGDLPARQAFVLAEGAKRRLIFQLDELGLPHDPRRLGFRLLSSRDQPVTTGHANGVITLDLAEGDDAHREALRNQMDEPYRTLLGHFRHETGHFYWDVLVDGTPAQRSFRELFGDERRDYGAALQTHYDQGPPPGWEEIYVSGYATAHPWEDWAESFAHYLHIRDTLQTAASFGVVVAGPDVPGEVLAAIPTDATDDFDTLIGTWHPFTLALNAVDRSMGKDDLYPFVLAPTVLGKLRFVHRMITG